MYNVEMVKTLFNQAGIKIEIEKRANGFIVEVPGKKNIYFWKNEIVTKQIFDDNIVKYYQEKNKES